MEIEVWKPIEGYEGIYEVSSFGRVRSLDRIVDFGNENYSRQMLCKGKIMKGSISRNGYIYVSLCLPNEKARAYIHRLVAKAFISNPNGYNVVNHKDENKKNNNVLNLEWCTTKYNLNYGTGVERARLKRLNNEKLSKKIAQYTLDGKLVGIYPSLHEIQRSLGYIRCNVRQCCEGNRKQSYGFKWEYIN